MGQVPQVIVVADTGPLLCAGLASPGDGRNALHARSKGKRLIIPQSIEGEIRHKLRDDDLRIVKAAELFLGRQGRYVERVPISYSKAERRVVLTEVRRQEIVIAQRKRKDPKLDGHGGETEAILLAQEHNALFLSNDNAALAVARARGLSTATFAMVLAAQVADGRMEADVAAEICLDIEEVSYPGLRGATSMSITQLVRDLPATL